MNEKSACIQNMFEANGCPKHTFLVAYAKNSLSEAERAAIEEHLGHCKHLCEALLEGLYLEELTQAALQNEPSLREGLDQEALFRKVEPLLKKHSFPEKELKKKRPKLSLWTSLAAIGLLLWLVYFFAAPGTRMHQPPKQAGTDSVKTEPETNNNPTTSLDTNTENRPDQVSKEHSPLTPSKDKREMMAFAENRNLENMQKSLLRGQPTSILNPKPDTNAVVDKEIVFSWEGQAQEDNMLLEVLNNQELVVEEQKIQPQQSQLVLNVANWPEGLYYWRLMGKRELYFLGKFKIIHQ